MAIPQLPEQDPGQSELILPRVLNPYLNVWWTEQTVTDVPESMMGWLMAQGFEISNITEIPGTNPKTYKFTLNKAAMTPQQVLLSLCNSYTIAANEARDANQFRYNEIVTNWRQMIDTTHDQFNAQVEEQNSQGGIYLANLDEYMTEIEQLIADNRSQMVVDAEAVRTSLGQIDTRLVDLETNAQNNAVIINDLLTTQVENLQAYLTSYNAKLAELDDNFASHLADVLANISSLETVLDSHIIEYAQQFEVLASNYTAHASDIGNLLNIVDDNVTTYTSDVAAILEQLELDYQATETDLNTIRTTAGTLVESHATSYQAVLDLLLVDYNEHADIAREFLVNLGATELARINEQFAAALSNQIQQLTNRGYYSSSMIADITQRNERDRDEQIQLLNDRLNREKLDNQHKLYEQQVGVRARTLDGSDRLHAVRQEVLRYQASLISNVYALLQEARNRILAGKQAIYAAKDANAKFAITISSDLYAKLQDVRQRMIESSDRIYQLRDVFAKWSNGEKVRLYEQVQQVEALHIAGIDRQFAGKQDVTRGEMTQRDNLLQQIQTALNGLLSGRERYSSLLLQIATALSDAKNRAIVERMNAAVQRLEGHKVIADQNTRLMAYQLDERNKLLVGLYGFVERREDIAPEWKDMAQMIAGLGDSGGGWLTPN